MNEISVNQADAAPVAGGDDRASGGGERGGGGGHLPGEAAPSLPDEVAMRRALEEAGAAPGHGDVPVGAVAVAGGEVVAAAHNERERRRDPSAHAELLALREAASRMGRWRLTDVTLVSTLEPCPMCAGAMVAARVIRVVFGAADPRAGACGSLYNLCCDPRLNHEVQVTAGVMADEASALLQDFFAARRPGSA